MRALTILLIFCAFQVSAQDEEEEKRKLPQVDTDYHKYLDDGTKGTSNAFMLSADMFIPGYLQVTYERKITPTISFGFIGGTKLFNGVDILDGMRSKNLHSKDIDGNSLSNELTKSYILGFSTRLRTAQYSMFDGWFAIGQGRTRVETFQNPDLEYRRTDLGLGYGYAGRLSPMIKWEVISIFGYRISEFSGEPFIPEEGFVTFSLGMNIGLLF